MTRHSFVIAALLVVAGLTSAWGQDAAADDGAFDSSAFDQAAQQADGGQGSATKGAGQQSSGQQAAKLEYLVGGSFVSNNTISASTALDWYAVGGSFAGKVFAKLTVPDFGALYIGYNLSHNLYQGAAGSIPPAAAAFLSAPAGDLYSVSYSLAELYYSFDVAKAVFFRLGNQLIAWGASSIWTPVDFINLQRANPLSPVDRRVGKPGLRVHVPLDGSNVFLFADFSGTITPSGVQDPLASTNLAARWDLTVAGFELALTGYWGQSIQNRYGFDFSGRLLGFDVYGEIAAAFPSGSYDLAVAGSVGFQRTLGELGYWSIASEFFYNSTGTADTLGYPVLIATGRFVPLYVGQYYAYGSLTRSHLVVDGVSAAVSGLANISDGSYQLSASTTLDLPRIPAFTLSVRYSGGGSGKEFTYATGDGALSAGLQVRFEF